jgi:hypothetical protein
MHKVLKKNIKKKLGEIKDELYFILKEYFLL